jgi:hypothetical protein
MRRVSLAIFGRARNEEVCIKRAEVGASIVTRNKMCSGHGRFIARAAGRLRHRAKRPELTVDAIVIATAAHYPHSIVLTSDPDDLTLLASHCPEAGLTIRSVSASVEPRKKQRGAKHAGACYRNTSTFWRFREFDERIAHFKKSKGHYAF